MKDLYTTWRALPLLTRALTALPLFVMVILASASSLLSVIAWVTRKTANRRSAGEALADEAEAGADQAEARAEALSEDLSPRREAEDDRRSDLAALAEREAGERYDRHDGLHGPDPWGGE